MQNLIVTGRLEIRDKGSNLISLREFESKSLVSNFSQIIANMFLNPINTYSQNVTDVTGVSRGVVNSSFSQTGFCVCNATSSAVYPGICYGIGTTPVPAPANYVLANLIAYGSGAGQLVYNAQTFPLGVTTGNPTTQDTSFTVQRIAQNSSGGSISISEMGMVVGVAAGYNTLILHDMFTAVPIANTHTAIGAYTFKATT